MVGLIFLHNCSKPLVLFCNGVDSGLWGAFGHSKCASGTMASSTRTSFRPRPLDNNKQLEIVRDENADLQSVGPIDQADIEATRRITNGHETLDAHNEKVRRQNARQPAVMVPGALAVHLL